MEKRLHREVKRDTHGRGTYTERKLHKKGQRYVQREKGNNTGWGKGCNKLIAICSKMQ